MANLAQLRRLEDLNAFLLVDKPAALPCPSVIKTIKRKFNLVKVSHGGSLDAAASGLVVVLINDANKFVGDVMGADREYTGTIRLGVTSNTNDAQGEMSETNSACDFPQAALDAAAREWKGDIFQTEPQFCAVRREASAGYEIVDTGPHQPLLSHVYRFSVENAGEKKLSFSLVGTKGVIVRSLAHDFGQTLGCGAVLETVRRTRIGKFKIEDAFAFDKILELDAEGLMACAIPLSKALQ